MRFYVFLDFTGFRADLEYLEKELVNFQKSQRAFLKIYIGQGKVRGKYFIKNIFFLQSPT